MFSPVLSVRYLVMVVRKVMIVVLIGVLQNCASCCGNDDVLKLISTVDQVDDLLLFIPLPMR